MNEVKKKQRVHPVNLRTVKKPMVELITKEVFE